MNKEIFTFTFTGSKAKELATAFSAYLWDGGLDQILEQSLLEDFGLDCSDMEMVPDGCTIKTDK